MTDVLDSALLIDAAHEAITVGDYRKAERLLRDAAAAMEASLGPEHPELARTLHDHAFICERTNNLAEAEQSYRRAHAIAVKALSPRDPFVATSVRNLVNFCAAHAIPIWTPPASGPLSDAANAAPAEASELDLYASEADASKREETPRVSETVQPKAVPIEPVPIETVPIETVPIEGAPIEAGPIEISSFDIASAEPGAPEPDPFQGDVFDPAPRETTSFEAAPIETASLETAPIEHAPLQAAPSEAPVFAADPFETSASALTTERHAAFDPLVPSAVPVAVPRRAVRRRSDVTGRVIALLVGAALVIVAVPFALRWSRSAFPGATPEPPVTAQTSASAAAAPAATTATRARTATSDATPPRADTPATPRPAAAPSNPVPAQRLEPPPAVAPPTPRTADAAAPQVTVLQARLCRTISKQGSPDWQCTPAEGDDLRPGNYFFYTRLLASANTTVEHRWYRDNREHKVITLSITASPGVGYRTISSTNIGADRVGDWRVELRAADGTLLQEERFSIHN